MYDEYLLVSRRLEYRGSDFFTLLKIWHQWVQNDYRPEWAEHNYLSKEVLDEATNIRGELLEIVRKTKYSLQDLKDKDLDKRIEKTLISAFRYNLLSRQLTGSYKNLRTGETGIRLHNSSVLLANKPYFAITFEVIEIAEIDANPKLSARVLHSVNDNVLRQFFPEAFKNSKKKSGKGDREQEFKKKKKFHSSHQKGKGRDKFGNGRRSKHRD
jgi:hypothetical protein